MWMNAPPHTRAVSFVSILTAVSDVRVLVDTPLSQINAAAEFFQVRVLNRTAV